jgi:preprotein translocase subunit YajC
MGEWSVLIIQFVIIIAVFYFLLIRPQKKQQQRIQNMLDSMQINDKVVTVGGVIGKVVKIKEDEVLIETGAGAEKSQIKFQKSAISKVLTIHE